MENCGIYTCSTCYPHSQGECSKCKKLQTENKALKDALANMYGLFGTPLLRLKMGSAWTSMHSEACKIARSLIDW